MDIFKNYESLWKSIIRPTRQTYNISDLGPNVILTKEKREKVKRVDFDLKNKLGLTLKCSYYEFSERNGPQPCVLYLHCNSGSRLEGQMYVDSLINKGMSVCIFDFAGSGQSEGEYISLGYYELGDVEVVVNYLKSNWKISRIGIWGRSMGAVTGLMYIQNDSSIIAGCFDSPFSNFMKLAAEIGSMKTGLPKFIIKGALSLIQSTIMEKAKFNIEDLNVLKNLDKSIIPCQFITSKKDSFVKAHHTEKIQKNYKGENKIIYFDGDHHEQRPMKIVNDCADFFEKNLIQKQPIGESLQKQIKNVDNQQNSMFSQQQIQKQQQLIGQSSPMQGQNISSIKQQQSDFNKMQQIQQQQQQIQQQIQQQQMQRSRIQSVQAPNFSNNIGQSVERNYNNLDSYMSVQDLKNNISNPSSQPVIQATINPTIHHAHSRSSTPNIQINLDRKITPNLSEQKPAPAVPMIPAATSMFDNRQTSRNNEQKFSSRIHSFHTSGSNTHNQFNFNQPALLNANSHNITIVPENPVVNVENIPFKQFIPAPGSGSNTNSSHQQQKSFTTSNHQIIQQKNINRNSNSTNQISHGRERSNTSFTSAMDIHREQGTYQCFNLNTQNTIYSNTNIQNTQCPSTPLIHQQSDNRDTSIDYSQKIGIGYTSKETTPQIAFSRSQTPNIYNNDVRAFNSPDTFQQQQLLSQQKIQVSQLQSNHQQQHLIKSQSLNINENIVMSSNNIAFQGVNQEVQKPISINANGLQNIQVHIKNGSRAQFENLQSNPEPLDSSVQHSEIQRFRAATTMDITQPLHQDPFDEFLVSTQSNNIYSNNNLNYKINRPRAQCSQNYQQFTQPLNKTNSSNNEFLFEKMNTQPKSNSLIDDELSSNTNIPLNLVNGTSSNSSTSIKNNQILTQLSNNNKSSINNQNQSIVSLTDQQSIFSPRQGNNQSINNSIIITSNNQINNITNTSITHNNNSGLIRIGQEMSKECKTNTTKLINPEGDNESIISCDSTILNKSIIINASSQKKPGTMNYTTHQGVTNQMSKSTNNNQNQYNNSGKKSTGVQNFYTNKTSNQQTTMISSKSSNTISTKNADNKNTGLLNNYENQNICITPRTKQSLNSINDSSQKLGSNSNASNQNNKTKQQSSQNNIPVSQFTNNLIQSSGNKNNIIVTSNSKSSKNIINPKNVLQNSNVDNKGKQSSTQKVQANISNQQQTTSAQNSYILSQAYSTTNTEIPKNGHQKNQSKFDFKNKRSTNNVPVQRVKFNKNENISPYQTEIIPAQFKNMYSTKINLFDISEKSPSGNQIIASQVNQQLHLKTNCNNNNLENEAVPLPKLKNQQSDSSMIIKDKYTSINNKVNESIVDNSNKTHEYQKQQHLNTTISQVEEDTLKKNRSSTTPTFKPDFIKNLQNTKVIHVLSKNEESIPQKNLQMGFNSYQNHIMNQQYVANNNKIQNYQTSQNDIQYNLNYGTNKSPQYVYSNIQSSNFQNKAN